MEDNPKPPGDSLPDVPESTELQQPEEPQPEVLQPEEPQPEVPQPEVPQPETAAQAEQESPSLRPTRTTQVDEVESFFLQLYPNTTIRSWVELFARSSSSLPMNDSQQEIYLHREMGLHSTISFLINATIGAAMFLTPPMVLERAGSVTEALLVWLFCGVFSLLIAVTYGEFLFLVSQTGGKFGYLLTAFSPINKFFGPLPAFLDIWIEGFFLRPAQVSVLAILLADQLCRAFPSSIKINNKLDITEPVVVKQVIGVAVIGLITCINLKSIKTFIRIQNTLVVLKVFVCFLVIGAGVHSFSLGNVKSFKTLFQDMKGNTTGLLKAVHVGMFTYEGMNIPLAILCGLPIVTTFYLAMNIAYLSVLTASEMKEASAAFVNTFGEKAFGRFNVVMPVFWAITTLSCSMCVQFGGSRSVFAAGREGHMPEVHSYLHVHRFVPIPALLTQAVLSLIFLSYIPIMDLIEYVNFVQWMFYGFSFVSLIILRAKMKDTYRLYKTPLSIPIILTIVSILVTLEPMIRSPAEFFTGATLLCIGVIIYYLFVYKQKRIRSIDKLNNFVQVALNVSPPTALPEGYRHSINTRTKSIARYLHKREKYYF